MITNISHDHLGADGIDELDELVSLKALVADQLRHGGSVVLNASDKRVAAIADRPAVRANAPVIRYFSAAPGCGVIERHKRSGGICYEVCDGQLTEAEGSRQRVIMNVAELPGSFGGRARHLVANALAAAAACRAIGVSIKDIRAALTSFSPIQANPGRGNLYAAPTGRSEPGPVLVDYGHNAAALLATGELMAATWGGDQVAAITLPGDRRDDLVAESAEAVATWFAAVVIYEDQDLRGRAPGEMRELVAAGMRRARPDIVIRHARGTHDALLQALTLAAPAGQPPGTTTKAVLLIYEKLSDARSALDSIGATPWPQVDLASPRAGDHIIDELARELVAEEDSVSPLASGRS